MTDNEKKIIIKSQTKEEDDTILGAFLNMAKEKVLRKMYPFKEDISTDEVPPKYDYVQIQIAVYLLNKRGAEGEVAHNENGINRTYESSDVPDSLLSQVVPFVGAI